jgi:hypothetical protein
MCFKWWVTGEVVLRRIFGPKRDEVTGEWRKLHNEELSFSISIPSIPRPCEQFLSFMFPCEGIVSFTSVWCVLLCLPVSSSLTCLLNKVVVSPVIYGLPDDIYIFRIYFRFRIYFVSNWSQLYQPPMTYLHLKNFRKKIELNLLTHWKLW